MSFILALLRGAERSCREMFQVPRNRRAAWASWIVMFMQQVSVSLGFTPGPH